MVPVRQLSEAEITAIAATHCGIEPRRWKRYTEPTVDSESDEVCLTELSYDERIAALLATALYSRKPH